MSPYENGPENTYSVLGSHRGKREILELGNLGLVEGRKARALCYVANTKGINDRCFRSAPGNN